MARAMTGHPRARPRLASCLAVLTVAFLLTAVPTLALPPTLTQFGLDLSLDRVELVFSEPVNISTFDANAWFLTSNATTNEEQLYLTDGVISSPDGGTTLYLNLSTATVDGLASREQLGRTTQSTFVNADNAGVTDLQAEDWQTLAQGKPPDYIVPDIEGPVITSATLNMSNGDVFFALSETVDETSFLATWASILCLERAQYVTTVKANVTTVTTRQGRATISARDLNVLKLLQCATIVLTTVVNAFDDQFQNAHEAANVTMFTFPDTTSPELTAFDLNMTSGELVLEFSEPVLASSLDLSALVLANDTDAAFAVRTALDNGTASAVDGTQLRITLSVSVVDAIKLAANTAQAAAATFLDASGALVADMAGQPSVAVAALPVRVLAPDAVAPVLVSYGVRMDQARPPIVLTLVFSEPVDVGALNHTALVFQSNATAATSAESYRLQHAPAAVVPSSSQRQVAIELATGDFLALRDAAGLAVLMRSAATTYLRFDPVLVTDTIGSSVVGVSAVDGAVAPSEYTVDLVPPQLSAFDVDMDAGFVVLRFSEDVNASSIAVGAFSLVAARGANVTAEGVTFDAALDAASSTGNATQVRIDLSVSTLNRVKADAGLAVSRSTSFLAVAAGGIADFAGNSMRQVASASAVAAVSYVADATGPVLQSFALNMTSGVLRLTFDEVVARATFDATQARLVNAATGATVAVALDAVAVDAPAANSTTLGFTLTQAAANEVRARTGLGTTVDNTYLQLLAGAIRDAAGNANLPVTANATQVVQDALPARLLALSLNMDSGVLSLSYSEPVQALTLVPAAITLARAANSTSTYTLAHSTVVTSGYTQVVDVALGAEDITALKLAGICLFQDACAVSANGTLVQDATGAFVPAVADAEINDVFVADQTAPALADRGFLYFDLNNGTIALSFTEVVNVTSARPTRITLQSFFESPEASYTLTGGRVLGGYHSGPGSTVVLIALSTSDLNAVKAPAT
ncbi:hypothetical protein PTSG_12325 [Salpingoeca rosetta]|uniref:SbsA Ig-like domain-containing protein n=1 Tax=Salpingoeca rosetta (strain ATCC 50818 / BSB-021) TaxID=946362 RepID=F2UBC1_SALR5|nr:uncharacterized protein PTSG_12325 [Salpingoeca rosetta]EGD73787.1 hypothetical protein PTSG_12325 [Salpingoeca rosetta]|eukprot:XP_004993350.1 hypothetical protein PTSG_12325 [Salpingoeca rosetta]